MIKIRKHTTVESQFSIYIFVKWATNLSAIVFLSSKNCILSKNKSADLAIIIIKIFKDF